MVGDRPKPWSSNESFGPTDVPHLPQRRTEVWSVGLPGCPSRATPEPDAFEGTSYDGVPYMPVDYDDVVTSADDDSADWGDTPTPPTTEDNCLAWANSAPVKAALAAVGEPDGSDGWGYQFARHLLGYVDAVEKVTDDVSMPNAIAAISTWNWHLNKLAGSLGMTDKWNGSREMRNFWGHMPSEIPTMLLSSTIAGRTMTFDNCAWLLGVTPNQLEAVMWPRSDRTALYFAAETLDCYPNATIDVVAVQHNLARSTVSSYMRLRRGRKLRPGAQAALTDTDLATALRWMDEDGLTWQDAQARLLAAGAIGSAYRPNSFYKRVHTALKLRAA